MDRFRDRGIRPRRAAVSPHASISFSWGPDFLAAFEAALRSWEDKVPEVKRAFREMVREAYRGTPRYSKVTDAMSDRELAAASMMLAVRCLNTAAEKKVNWFNLGAGFACAFVIGRWIERAVTSVAEKGTLDPSSSIR